MPGLLRSWLLGLFAATLGSAAVIGVGWVPAGAVTRSYTSMPVAGAVPNPDPVPVPTSVRSNPSSSVPIYIPIGSGSRSSSSGGWSSGK